MVCFCIFTVNHVIYKIDLTFFAAALKASLCGISGWAALMRWISSLISSNIYIHIAAYKRASYIKYTQLN